MSNIMQIDKLKYKQEYVNYLDTVNQKSHLQINSF